MSTSIPNNLRQQIAEANTRVALAEAAYNHATGEWVDVAAYEVKTAREALSALLREARGETKVGGDEQ